MLSQLLNLVLVSLSLVNFSCFLQTEPYTMLVKDSEQKTGNDRYEGYNMDLIKEISKILGFNYTIRIVEDGNYGSYDKKTETWNGMIGELLAQVKKIT